MQVIDREQFAAGQKEMIDNWVANLKAKGIDVPLYLLGREDAYLDRWREAARFIPDGSRVLDIGGGSSTKRIFEFFKSRQYDYYYLDIGEDLVALAKKLSATIGFDPKKMQVGFNDDLPFEDEYFDSIFSSHCIEHSFDLLKTMRELNRVLKFGGNVMIAVPLGWEVNPAHPYFFGTPEWLSLVMDGGFELRVWQIGKEYPESGYDLFIAARKTALPKGKFRIDPERYQKDNLIFLPFTDARFRYFGKSVKKDDYIIMMGTDWNINFEVESDVAEILPIFFRHGWSGIISILFSGTTDYVVEDLFSVQSWVQPARMQLPGARSYPGIASIQPIGRNPASLETEGVFVGALFRRAGRAAD